MHGVGVGVGVGVAVAVGVAVGVRVAVGVAVGVCVGVGVAVGSTVSKCRFPILSSAGDALAACKMILRTPVWPAMFEIGTTASS